jgi:hypothetical protein
MSTTVIANRLGDIRAERDTRMLDIAFYETPDYRTLLATWPEPYCPRTAYCGTSSRWI